MPTTTTERRRRRHADRQRAILRAAAEEFATAGYERATLERIGDRVGLSKGSLYYYVDGKEHLLVLLLEAVVDELLEAVDPTAPPAERLRQLVRAHVAATLGPEGRVLVENLDAIPDSEATAAVRARYAATLRDLLTDGIADGTFHEVPIRATVRFLLGGLNAACRRFRPTTEEDTERLVDSLTRLVLDGIVRR
ncbi:MAG TPA: TetR/AcrR family transcriptional regulator [Actinobacteria bacterium]|nr:TetR/AcrR family transcriptional regulator [Actinomycetota bacterium]